MNRQQIDTLHVMLLGVAGDPAFVALSTASQDKIRAALRFTSPHGAPRSLTDADWRARLDAVGHSPGYDAFWHNDDVPAGWRAALGRVLDRARGRR